MQSFGDRVRKFLIKRWLKLWSPYDSRLQLSGIQLPDGAIVADPKEQATALRNHWASVFARKPVSTKLAKQVLDRHQPKIDPREPESIFPDSAPPIASVGLVFGKTDREKARNSWTLRQRAFQDLSRSRWFPSMYMFGIML